MIKVRNTQQVTFALVLSLTNESYEAFEKNCSACPHAKWQRLKAHTLAQQRKNTRASLRNAAFFFHAPNDSECSDFHGACGKRSDVITPLREKELDLSFEESCTCRAQ